MDVSKPEQQAQAAVSVLENLIDSGIKAGLFKDRQSVFACHNALEFLANYINQLTVKNNGKEEKTFQQKESNHSISNKS